MSRSPRSLHGALLLVGCSCSSSTTPAQEWAGKWSQSGTETTDCGGVSTKVALGGAVSLSASPSGTTFASTTTCSLAWTVGGANDDSASLALGPGCDVPISDAAAAVFTPAEGAPDKLEPWLAEAGGEPGSVTFTSGSGTLNGSTIELTAAGSTAGGCTLMVAATLTRIAVPPQGSR